MPRSQLLVVAVLIALAATLSLLFWREAGESRSLSGRSQAAQRAEAGANGGTRPGKSVFHPVEGKHSSGTSANAPAEDAANDGKEPPAEGALDMPTTAAGFIALLRDLAARGHEGDDNDLLERVMEDFRALLEKDPDQRRAAVELFRVEGSADVLELLAMIFGRANLPDLKEAMMQVAQSDTSPARREQALAALGFYESADVVPVALGIIRSETDPAIQAKAVEALPDIPPNDVPAAQRAEVAGHLARLAQSPDVNLRIMAVRTLGDWSDESYTPTLLSGLKDPEMTVRATAAFALSLRAERSPPAKEALLRVLQDSSEHIQVRGSAADALHNWATTDPEIRSAVAAFQQWETTQKNNEESGAEPANPR